MVSESYIPEVNTLGTLSDLNIDKHGCISVAKESGYSVQVSDTTNISDITDTNLPSIEQNLP